MDNASSSVQNTPSAMLINTTIASAKKSNLPRLLIIFGILELCFPVYLIYTIVPQFISLIRNINDDPNGFLFLVFPAVIFGLIIAQVFYGITLARKQKHKEGLAPLQEKIALIMLLVGIIASVIFIPTMIYSNIMVIYSLMDNF